MGKTDGWIPDGYLDRHARQVRRRLPLPSAVWQALIDHHDPADTRRLADAADRRDLGRVAEALHCALLDEGAVDVGRWLGLHLAHSGRDGIDDLRRRSGTDRSAAEQLDALLFERRETAELRRRRDDGDRAAGWWLAKLPAAQVGIVVNGPMQAAMAASNKLLADRFRPPQPRSQPYVPNAAAEAEADAAAKALAEAGEFEQLRTMSDAGDDHAGWWLSRVLAGSGRLDELAQEVAAGTAGAARLLHQHRPRLGRGARPRPVRRPIPEPPD